MILPHCMDNSYAKVPLAELWDHIAEVTINDLKFSHKKLSTNSEDGLWRLSTTGDSFSIVYVT